ncbi:MAG: hypothetical protein M3157_04460, partial [Actinomycetota bacterium]|nr:hypothetical protein [Actinomycetota bacterium]
MRFYRVPVEEREVVGGYTLLRYRWKGLVEPGQFVMARTAGFPDTLDPLLARPLSFYDHDGAVASLLLEVRGRGTALLDRSPEIEVTAPLGRSFSTDGFDGRAALLGGGVGVAPMKILSRCLDGLGVDYDLFLGFADSRTSRISRDFPGAGVATVDGSEGTT